MIRVFFSDSISKEYPVVAKAILSCDKDRPAEILGILESLLKQTGLNPEEKLSLGYLRRGLALGKLRVIETADPMGSNPAIGQNDPEPEDTPDLFGTKNVESTKFNKTPDIFGMSFDSL